jgi:hypothetical protein
MLSIIKKIGNFIFTVAQAIHDAKKTKGYVALY